MGLLELHGRVAEGVGGSGFNRIEGGLLNEWEGVGLMELLEGWRRSRRE